MIDGGLLNFMGLELREEAARQRVAEARTKLIEFGAHAVEDAGAQRIAAVLPISAAAYQHIAPALLPLWLELTAPLLLSIGLAPLRNQAKVRVRKRRKRAAPPSGSAAPLPLRRVS